ncbi:MAG: hypothetical protein DRI57_17380 [Deltaproteobacteria bacterium]|nr:MAG: hypothetical protein DRI57_17380 [Deltaproteobacteria bacterium]
MDIKEYFDHIAPNDIRIRGTRVGIESVLYEFIHREQPPEAIVRRFPSVTLEQVYATILYYLHNKQMTEAYLAEWLAYGRHKRAEQAENPPPVVARLRILKQKHHRTSATL